MNVVDRCASGLAWFGGGAGGISPWLRVVGTPGASLSWRLSAHLAVSAPLWLRAPQSSTEGRSGYLMATDLSPYGVFLVIPVVPVVNKFFSVIRLHPRIPTAVFKNTSLFGQVQERSPWPQSLNRQAPSLFLFLLFFLF